MTIDEYFAQDEYFSESQREFVNIDSMNWLRAYYSFRKLMTAAPDVFPNTNLWYKFNARLSPPSHQLADELQKYGKVSCAYKVRGEEGISHRQARARLYSAAKHVGVKVTTHNARKDSKGGNFITAEILIPDMTVRVKGRELA